MNYYKIIKNIIKRKTIIFPNIAEGTHAGSISLNAAEDINNSHLLVSFDDSGESIVVCSGSSLPIGVALDECDINERVTVALAGSAESTFMCRCATDINAGDELYTTLGGKVTNIPSVTSYKVGVALNSSSIDGVVEVDTQEFASKATQASNAGIHIWTTSDKNETIEVENISEGDIVIATFKAIGGSEKVVSASAGNGEIKFTLDVAGTPNQTKISWITINNN
ncbi:MAG: DUF2190 family protein [Opitutales bacterium]|nr:DUF2190 family protein [Opitutales bacterium]